MRLFAILSLTLIFNCIKAQEITLFDIDGKATAYLVNDVDQTIFLWGGKPVAYMSGDNVYGFDGKHLGWWSKGVIRDHDGNVVGSTKDAMDIRTEYEPYKGYKQYKPYKSYREYPPYKPYWRSYWSNMPFFMFLLGEE